MPGPPFKPASEAMLTIAPPPLSLKCGTPYFAPKKQDLGLTCMSRSQSDSSNSVTLPERCAPALLTMTSMPPMNSAAPPMSACISCALDTSVRTKRARSPPFSAFTVSTVSWAPSSLRSPTTTRAPSLANRRAVALPIPVAAPVITASFPSSCIFSTSGVSLRLRHTRGRRGRYLVILIDGAPCDTYCTHDLIADPKGAPTGEGDERTLMRVLKPEERLTGLRHGTYVPGVHIHRP